MPSRAKSKKRAISIVAALISLLLGVFLGAVVDHYIIPLYFEPHANLRIGYSYPDADITVDNINGKAPIDWAKITITATKGTIERVNMTGTSPFDISDNQFSTDHKAYFFIINHMSPDDWGVVNLVMSESSEFTVEVSSSSDYVLGDKVTVFNASNMNGAWGAEESFGDWIKQHPNYQP
jgi:hypothetical protein